MPTVRQTACHSLQNAFVHISCLIISAPVVSSGPWSQREPTEIVFQSSALQKNCSQLFVANGVGWRVLCVLKIVQKGDAFSSGSLSSGPVSHKPSSGEQRTVKEFVWPNHEPDIWLFPLTRFPRITRPFPTPTPKYLRH